MDELLSIQTLKARQGNLLLGDFANIIAKWTGYPFIQWNMNLLGEVLKNHGVFVTEMSGLNKTSEGRKEK